MHRQLVTAVGHTALAILVALAAVLLLRRLGGRFHRPLSVSTIIMAAVVIELAVFGLRWLYQAPLFQNSALCTKYFVLNTPSWVRRSVHQHVLRVSSVQIRFSPLDLATTAAILIIAIALSIPGTSSAGLFIAWLIIAGSEIGQRFSQFPKWAARSTISQDRPASPSEQPRIPSSDQLENELTEPEVPPGLIQQLTRVIEGDHESIHALVKAEMAVNDRLGIVHIAFCPPLAERPELSAHALDCDDAEVRLTQVESFGARLEARLPAVSETRRSLMIEILGSAKASPCS